MSSQSFEEKVEDYRRRLGEEHADLRGSTLSIGTFSSVGMTEDRSRAPLRTRIASPSKYARNVQSADSTLIEESMSPTSLLQAGSPRFLDEASSFVSDYVAFGKESKKTEPRADTRTDSAFETENTRLVEARHRQDSEAHELAQLRTEVALRVRETESLRASLLAAERQLRDTKEALASRTEEWATLKKERGKLLKDVDEYRKKEAERDHDLRALAVEADKLRSELRNALRQRQDQESEEQTLRADNSALRQRVVELELLLKEGQRPRQNRKRSNPKHRSDDSKSPSAATQRKLLRDLQDLLALDSAAELLPHVKGLLRKARTLAAASEFIEKINGIVVQYSPPGAFVRPPSLKQVWKWVSRLIDEYMALRKAHDSKASADRVLTDLQELLGVAHYTQLPRAVELLQRTVK